MPTQNTSSLQDKFLKYLRDKRSEVTIFLANGREFSIRLWREKQGTL